MSGGSKAEEEPTPEEPSLESNPAALPTPSTGEPSVNPSSPSAPETTSAEAPLIKEGEFSVGEAFSEERLEPVVTVSVTPAQTSAPIVSNNDVIVETINDGKASGAGNDRLSVFGALIVALVCLA